jgi:hypothetical protein
MGNRPEGLIGMIEEEEEEEENFVTHLSNISRSFHET